VFLAEPDLAVWTTITVGILRSTAGGTKLIPCWILLWHVIPSLLNGTIEARRSAYELTTLAIR
jgi:hypothetical protein